MGGLGTVTSSTTPSTLRDTEAAPEIKAGLSLVTFSAAMVSKVSCDRGGK